MKPYLKLFLAIVGSGTLAAALHAGPPTVTDVGDPGSFGHNAQYMGAKSGFITLTASCTPAPSPVPPATAHDDQCINLNPAPASTNWTANDILRVNLPANSTRTIIYPVLNFFVGYQLNNTIGAFQPHGIFNFTAEVVIESAVLADPSIIDPTTGMPANGSLGVQFTDTHIDDQSMQTGDRHRMRDTLVRVGNAGINKAQLVAAGWPQPVIDEVFKKPMTLRMNVSGTAQLVDSGAAITCNMRLFGD
jgi:hypothetical protein